MSPLLSRVEQAAKKFIRFLKNKNGDRNSADGKMLKRNGKKREKKINDKLNKQDKKSACVRTEGENYGLVRRGYICEIIIGKAGL